MVTVTAFQPRTSQEGREFFSLELTSDDLEMVISQQTGRFYATAYRCWITSTFTKATCQKMVGKTLPGTIIRSECESYEFTIPETGEVITRTHCYEYCPIEQRSMEQTVLAQTPLLEVV